MATSPKWKFILIVTPSRNGRGLIEQVLGVYGLTDVMQMKSKYTTMYGHHRIIQEFLE